MKIIWLTNILFPEVNDLLNQERTVLGGWMYSSALELIKDKGINLTIVSLYSGKNIKILDSNELNYILFPRKFLSPGSIKKAKDIWTFIYNKVHPDIIHMHGTEYASFGLSYLDTCGDKGVVVSIQGLVGIYSRYYFSGIRICELNHFFSFREFLFHDSIERQADSLRKRGENEFMLIKSVKNIIGRTNWDKTHVKTINPDIKYFFCNETLRKEFFGFKWSYEKCEKYSIFLSQASSPIKGLHIAIKALYIVKTKYPQSKLYIAGYDFIHTNGLIDKLKQFKYSKYILHLIEIYKLEDNVIFTGPLQPEKMCERYLKSNVFVCPSSIENSPNSLGEAQILGVPVISSYVGGTMDMIENNVTGYLYRFEEFEMLAAIICSIFEERENISLDLNKEKLIAMERHDPQKNAEKLRDIYKSIFQKN